MKPSSIGLWSMICAPLVVAGTLAGPVDTAEAGWRDRVVIEDGWDDGPYPSAYVHRRPVEVYPGPLYRRDGLVYERPVYERRVRRAHVDPYGVDEGPIDEGADPDALIPYDAYGPDPYRRPARLVPVRPRMRGQPALPDRASTDGDGPAVVPGLAPDGRRKKAPKVAEARIALPVRRPNLEGLDFAPSEPPPPLATGDRR